MPWGALMRRKSELRRKSMLGTALFVLDIIAAIVSAVTGSVWVIVAAVVFFVAEGSIRRLLEGP
jgi:hypothetical protein